MGEIADDLVDQGYEEYDNHLLGLCDEYCHYCYQEYMYNQPNNPIAVKLLNSIGKRYRE